MSNIVLEAKSLSKIFKDGDNKIELFDNFNIQIKKNELVAIVGKSGVGKSTLLHILGGLESPTSGRVFVFGNNISSLNKKEQGKIRNQHIGFVYQFHHLLPEFSVLENVAMPILIGGGNIKPAKKYAIMLLGLVGLKDRINSMVGILSGGERQRVAIARALANKPDVILADEPTGNLDKENQEMVFNLIISIQKELSTSFLIVTHDSQLAEKMNRIIFL